MMRLTPLLLLGVSLPLAAQSPAKGAAPGKYPAAPAAAMAAYVSFLAGALTMSLELIASGTSPAELVLPTMLGVHAIIGIGEALITAATLAFIASTRRDLLAVRSAVDDYLADHRVDWKP